MDVLALGLMRNQRRRKPESHTKNSPINLSSAAERERERETKLLFSSTHQQTIVQKLLHYWFSVSFLFTNTTSKGFVLIMVHSENH